MLFDGNRKFAIENTFLLSQSRNSESCEAGAKVRVVLHQPSLGNTAPLPFVSHTCFVGQEPRQAARKKSEFDFLRNSPSQA